jgi:hypothetical protein
VFSIIGTPTDIAVFAVVFPTIVAGILVNAIFIRPLVKEYCLQQATLGMLGSLCLLGQMECRRCQIDEILDCYYLVSYLLIYT